MNFYHIQTKFRDERRPRFGVMRGREFTMKDAYSFDRDAEGAAVSYDKMYQAYQRIFTRLGLRSSPMPVKTSSPTAPTATTPPTSSWPRPVRSLTFAPPLLKRW